MLYSVKFVDGIFCELNGHYGVLELSHMCMACRRGDMFLVYASCEHQAVHLWFEREVHGEHDPGARSVRGAVHDLAVRFRLPELAQPGEERPGRVPAAEGDRAAARVAPEAGPAGVQGTGTVGGKTITTS